MKLRNIINEELNTLLTEKLVEVENDVNLIYNKYFKNDIDEFNRTGVITNDIFKAYETNTSILTDELSVKAHELNPCEILINYGRNYYIPTKNRLSMSVDSGVVQAIKEYGSLNDVLKVLTTDKQQLFKYEISEHKLKGSIHHELTHWIDDTLHNRYISRHIDKLNTNDVNKYTKKFKENPLVVNATGFEINSQIHNIKQAYNYYKEFWNTMTFDQLKNTVPTINAVYNALPGRIREDWLKKLKKRMYREGLLGKKMY